MSTFCLGSEKPHWKRCRKCSFLLMLLLTLGTLLFTLYNSNPHPLGDLNFLRTNFRLSKPYTTNMTASPAATQVQMTKYLTSPYTVAYPQMYQFNLDEPNRCRQESPFLVLMIPVAPNNREARDIIRSTWGKETTVMGQLVSHYFLLGQPRDSEKTEQLHEEVLRESQTHHDILQSSFLDSYNNLTIKTMVMFEWLSSHCPNTSYAMKIDSDIFLNVHKLVDMLLKTPRKLYLTGMVVRGAAVLRDVNSKWFMPFSEYAEPYYPPYAMGLGYVFSMDLPQKILEASSHVKVVYIEDVYVGMCLRYLEIQVSDPPNGGFRATGPDGTGNCYWSNVITTILQDSNQLRDIWTAYQAQVQSGC